MTNKFQMPKLPPPLNLPLKVRGIKGVMSITPHNSPYPSYLKRGIRENFLKRGNLEKLMKSGCSGGKTV